MNLNKLIKLICAGTIVGACLLATGCNVNVNTGDTINNNGGETSKEAANAGLITYNDNGQEKVKSEKTNIDFTDYRNSADGYSILVGNNTGKRLVAFMGTPRTETLISGVQAGKSPFGLKKESTLFAGNGDFILFLVTENDYIEATKDGGDIASLANKPFARIYAVFNTNAPNKTVYPVSSIMEGACSIVLNNTDNDYNVELRQEGVNGDPLVYATHGSKITFKVDAGDYYLFPVFRKFDPNIGEIVTIYPKKLNGAAVREKFSLKSGEYPNGYPLDASKWANLTVGYSPSAAYIVIKNLSDNGIEFYKGDKLQKTSMGENYINKLESRQFIVPMECTSGSNTEDPKFSEYVSTSVYNVRGDHGEVYLTGNKETEFKLYAGKKYTVTIKDNPDPYAPQEIIVDPSWMDEGKDETVDIDMKDTTQPKTSLK